MNRKTGIIFLLLLFLMPLVAAAPTIQYVSPTPADGAAYTGAFIANVSMTTDSTYKYGFLDFDDAVFWYQFDNEAGESTTVFYDELGKLNASAATGATVSYNASRFTNGINTTLGGVVGDSVINLSSINGYSISAWLYPDIVPADAGSNAYRGIVTFGNGDIGLSYRNSYAGAPRLAFFDGGAWRSPVGHTVPNNEWTHVVGVYDGSNVYFYVNGVLDDSVAATVGTNITNQLPTVGQRDLTFSALQAFQGIIEEVVLFDRTLTADEVAALYNATNYHVALEGELPYSAYVHQDDDTSASVTRDFGEGGSITVDFPGTNYTFQRHTATQGIVRVLGTATMTSGNFEYIYAASGGTASGGGGGALPASAVSCCSTMQLNVTLPVGMWDLTILDADDNSINVTIEDVRVGDIWAIGGQSNGGGFFNSTDYTVSVDNSLNYSVRRWISPTGWAEHSNIDIWLELFQNLTRIHNVPVSIVKIYHNGASIDSWLNPTTDHIQSDIETISNMTNGTNKIAGFLFIQGETDVDNQKSYSNLLTNHSLVTAAFQANITTIWADMIYYQVNKAADSTKNPDTVRRAQVYLWNNNDFVDVGIVGYDISVEDAGSSVHYRQANQVIPFMKRWQRTLEYYAYDATTDYRGPQISSIQLYDNDSVRVTYDENIFIKNYTGGTGLDAIGWKIQNTTVVLNDTNGGVTSARKISARVIEINLSQAITSTGYTLSYANGLQSYMQPVPVDQYDMPTYPVWNLSLSYNAPSGDTNTSNLGRNTCYGALTGYSDVAGYLPIIVIALIFVVALGAVFAAIAFNNQDNPLMTTQDATSTIIFIALAIGVIAIVLVLIFSIGAKVTTLIC